MNAIRSTNRTADPRRTVHCRHLSSPGHLAASYTWRGVRRQARVTVHAYRMVLH